MKGQEHPEDRLHEPVPPGTCPLCGNPIHNPTGGGKFECQNCHRLIQSSTASQILHEVVCLGLATGICWLSGWPWLIKILVWPVLAVVLGAIYYTLAAFVWIPTYVEARPRPRRRGRKDEEPFQTLHLDK